MLREDRAGGSRMRVLDWLDGGAFMDGMIRMSRALLLSTHVLQHSGLLPPASVFARLLRSASAR